jgi:hypothetical protein
VSTLYSKLSSVEGNSSLSLCGVGCHHLDRDTSTEGSSIAWVDKLNNASVLLSSDSTSASSASRDSNLERIILVDVGGTLVDTSRSKELTRIEPPSLVLTLPDVTPVTGNLSNDIKSLPCLASTVGVDHSLVRTSTIRGNNV